MALADFEQTGSLETQGVLVLFTIGLLHVVVQMSWGLAAAQCADIFEITFKIISLYVDSNFHFGAF